MIEDKGMSGAALIVEPASGGRIETKTSHTSYVGMEPDLIKSNRNRHEGLREQRSSFEILGKMLQCWRKARISLPSMLSCSYFPAKEPLHRSLVPKLISRL